LQGTEGSFGGATFNYTFDTATNNSDPGSGKLKFSDGNIPLAFHLYINDTDNGGTNIDSFLQTISASTSSIKGFFKVSNRNSPNNYVLFSISAIVDNGSYYDVTSGYLSGSVTTFTDYNVLITFAVNGNKGDIGPQGVQGVQGVQSTQGVQGRSGESSGQGSQGAYGPIGGSIKQVIYKDLYNIAVGSDNLTFDGTKLVTYDEYVINNLGVGTATPAERFDVVGNIKLGGQLIVNDSAGIGTVITSIGTSRYLQNIIIDCGYY
jgi:hypothetical protein